MKPNGRTIYKVLMRGRGSVFWGLRAFVKVRLPASVIPVPCPPLDYTKDWGTEISGGLWEKDLGDGVSQIVYISHVTSGGDPREYGEDNGATIHFLHEEKHLYWNESLFQWWEGTLRRVNGTTPEETLQLPAEAVAAHKALHEWHRMYLDGLEDPSVARGPVLDAFMEATGCAKTHYTGFSGDGQFLYLTYSVKPMYKRRARQFCADLKRAFRVAAENGVKAKLMR